MNLDTHIPPPYQALRIAVTFFTDTRARTKREESLELAALVALIESTSAPTKARLPLLKLARFGDQPSSKGSLRCDRNIIAISGIELDYDAGVMAMATATQLLQEAGILAVAYTSPSHRPDFPKWRILCPFSQELAPAQRAPMVARVNGVLGGVCAPESFTLSQAYYFGVVVGNPHHRVALT